MAVHSAAGCSTEGVSSTAAFLKPKLLPVVTFAPVVVQILRTPTFWFVIIATYIVTFGMRFAERTAVWVFRPHDTMILAEKERKVGGGL